MAENSVRLVSDNAKVRSITIMQGLAVIQIEFSVQAIKQLFRANIRMNTTIQKLHFNKEYYHTNSDGKPGSGFDFKKPGYPGRVSRFQNIQVFECFPLD